MPAAEAGSQNHKHTQLIRARRLIFARLALISGTRMTIRLKAEQAFLDRNKAFYI
jgi:hypothetical protein